MTRYFSKILAVIWLIRAILLAVAQTALPVAALAGINPDAIQAKPATGVIRIGLMEPKVEMGPAEANASETLRALITQHVGGGKFEIVPLATALPAMAQAEAVRKDCDYLLFITFAEKKSQGINLLRVAEALLSNFPVVQMLGLGSLADERPSQAAVGTSTSPPNLVRAKSEVRLNYKLQACGQTEPMPGAARESPRSMTARTYSGR